MNTAMPKAPHILLVLTFFVFMIHLVSAGKMGDVGFLAYFMSLLYLVLFSVSFYVSLFILTVFAGGRANASYINYRPTGYTYLILCGALFSFLLIYSSLVGLSHSSFVELRSGLIGLYRSDEVSIEFRVLNTIGIFLFFLSSYLYIVSRKNASLYATIALLFPLLMANRNFILIFFLFAGFKLIFIQKKIIASFFLVAFFLFFNIIYVYAYDKGPGDLNIFYSTIISILSYIALPLHGLTYGLEQLHNYGSFLSLPSSFVAWLGYEVNRDFLYTPYPNQTNVYTLFYSLIYDFGVLGVAIFALIFGFFHAFLYFRAKRSSLFVFVCLYSFYPLLMTFFDNTYTTSLGVWFYIFLPFLFCKRERLVRL